jgi:hypothetical protein
MSPLAVTVTAIETRNVQPVGVDGVVVALEVVLVVLAVLTIIERSGRAMSKGDCAILGSSDNDQQILRSKFHCKFLLEILSESSTGKRTNSFPNSKAYSVFRFLKFDFQRTMGRKTYTSSQKVAMVRLLEQRQIDDQQQRVVRLPENWVSMLPKFVNGSKTLMRM